MYVAGARIPMCARRPAQSVSSPMRAVCPGLQEHSGRSLPRLRRQQRRKPERIKIVFTQHMCYSKNGFRGDFTVSPIGNVVWRAAHQIVIHAPTRHPGKLRLPRNDLHQPYGMRILSTVQGSGWSEAGNLVHR